MIRRKHRSHPKDVFETENVNQVCAGRVSIDHLARSMFDGCMVDEQPRDTIPA